MLKKTRFILLGLLLASFLAPALPAGAEESEGGKGAAKEEKKDDGKKSDVGTSGGRFAGDPIYVHLPPMVLPVINTQGIEQLVTLMLDIEVRDFDAADSIHSQMPRVQDALMQALYGGLGQGNLRNGKLVDVGKVKSKAMSAVGHIIGADNVRDILVQGVAQRML